MKLAMAVLGIGAPNRHVFWLSQRSRCTATPAGITDLDQTEHRPDRYVPALWKKPGLGVMARATETRGVRIHAPGSERAAEGRF
jgi:hypothetical protein